MSGDERRQAAVDAVDALLTGDPLNATKLTAVELQIYRSRKISHGWRLTIVFLDEPRRLDVLTGPAFPREPVLVADSVLDLDACRKGRRSVPPSIQRCH